jgi:hypothetical protein
MALNPAKEKYMRTSTASCDAIQLHKLLARLFEQELHPTIIYCDNQSCIKLSKNLICHDRSKLIEIRYHFIRDRIQKGTMKIQYISIDQQVVEIMTKPLAKGKLEAFRDLLGLVQNSFLIKREC